jgi:hypothetical protein
MDSNELEIVKIDETPPAQELRPEEIEALADELVDYQAEFADLYYLSWPNNTSVRRISH